MISNWVESENSGIDPDILLIQGSLAPRHLSFLPTRLFKDRLYGSRERVPKRVSGFDGMYSMKRLSET